MIHQWSFVNIYFSMVLQIRFTPKFLPDQMPKENERETHVRGLFDLRILH